MKYSLSVALVFYTLLTRAQSGNAIWSGISKAGKNAFEMSVIDTDSAGFYTAQSIREKTPAIEITRYGCSDMREVWRKRIELPVVEGCELSFEHLTRFTTHFLLFTSGIDEVSGHYKTFATFIDNAGNVSESNVLVQSMSREEHAERPTFRISVSPDRQKFLLLFVPASNKKVQEPIAMKFYTSELDIVWDKELELPYENDIVSVQHFIVDNAGSVYLMSGKNPEKTATSWQRAQGNRYVVFNFNYEANKLKEYDVSLKDKRVISIQYDLNKDNELIIGGYYSNDYTFSVAGTFLFVLSAGGESIKAAAFMAFPKEFLLTFMKESRAEKNAAIDDIYLDNLIINEDSSYTLVGEQYYISEQMMTDMTTGRQYVQTTYNFDDIVVSRLKPDGRIDWCVKVPKRQYSLSNNKLSSYTCYRDGSGVVIYFNDHPDNTERLAAKPQGEAAGWSGSRRSVTTEVRLGADGKLTRRALFFNEENDGFLKPGLSSRDIYGKSVLGYEDGRTYRFCLVP